MQKLLLFLLLFVHTLIASARETPRWLRYCAISPDGTTIAFAHKGQIYTVPSIGGKATMLTKDSSYHFMPVWSHDGKSIAFAGSRYGNFDIFIMPASGGEPLRLTAHSADEYPYDFSIGDDSVLFGAVRLDAPSNRQYPSDALQELYFVPSIGGRVAQVLTTPAEDAHISPSGRLIIYHDRKGRENPWRKHQRSAVARDIWLYDRQTGLHQQITSYDGEDRSAVFAGSDTSIFYLSEGSGSFNIFRKDLNSITQPLQITSFSGPPVRFLSISRNGALCFGYDGEIWCRRRNAAPYKVQVSIPGGSSQKDQRSIAIGDADEMAVAPDGKHIAFITRGDIFLANTDGSSPKRITATPGQETSVSFSPDGNNLLYAAERSGRWIICLSNIDNLPQESVPIHQTPVLTPNESILIANDHDCYQPQFSPDGSSIAYVQDRTNLIIYNIATHVSRPIPLDDRWYSRRDNDQYFKWSPDGKWLLIQYSAPGTGNDAFGLISTDGQNQTATLSTATGQLIPLSSGGFNDSHPVWANNSTIIWRSDRNGLRSYAGSATRQQDVYALSIPSGRRTRLTPSSTLMSDALLSDSTLFYLAKFEKGYDLWRTDLRTNKTTLLTPLAAGDAFMAKPNNKNTLFINADGNILSIDLSTGRIQTINTTGQMTIQPAAERQSMFLHIWQRTATTFYTTSLHGVDWKSIKTTYQRYLPDIDNNYDFAELLNEMLGELNVSHTGVTYRPPGKKDLTASLGIFYDQHFKDTGCRITEIIKDGPLDDPSLNIKPGTIITAIDGIPLSPDRDLATYLNQKAGRSTKITLDNKTTITIHPLTPDAETELLYQRWVTRNREETDSLSHGQLGYVHLPRMNDAAFRNIYDEALGRSVNKKGIIVDTRFNRGGDLAPELTMFLSGIHTRDNTARNKTISTEPSFRWTGLSIVLAGEANYSDGSCFVYDYQLLHMGKLVGMPIPGSCTFQTGQSLWDHTLQYSCPTLGVKDLHGDFLEGRQTEPDIRQRNDPDKVAAGRDQQLEKAIQQLLQEL